MLEQSDLLRSCRRSPPGRNRKSTRNQIWTLAFLGQVHLFRWACNDQILTVFSTDGRNGDADGAAQAGEGIYSGYTYTYASMPMFLVADAINTSRYGYRLEILKSQKQRAPVRAHSEAPSAEPAPSCLSADVFAAEFGQEEVRLSLSDGMEFGREAYIHTSTRVQDTGLFCSQLGYALEAKESQ